MPRPTTLVLTLALGAFAGSACDGGGELEAPEISVVREAIINGTQVPRGSLAGLGIVSVASGCTGTLVSNQHVLTARHCVRQWDEENGTGWGNPYPIGATLEGATPADDQTWPGTATEPVSAGLGTLDYALITLSNPMRVNGATDGFFNPIYGSADSTLRGKSSFCAGYGWNRTATHTTFGSSDGRLRSAQMTVDDASGGFVHYKPNASGQIQAPGDSGSACFVNSSIAGVTSTGGGGEYFDVDGDGKLEKAEQQTIAHCTHIAPSSFRSWVNGLILADATVTYTQVPSSTTAIRGTLSAPNATSAFTSGTGLSKVALRSGFYEVQATEPANTLCRRLGGTTPLSGSLALSGTCLGDGLVSSILGS